MTALKERGKEVAVTASIGMAAIPLRGTTVHHWAGLGDNRHTKEKILETLNEESKARITKADVLILDEVGMISEAVFSKLEFITRNVRGNNLVFGGLQVRN